MILRWFRNRKLSPGQQLAREGVRQRKQRIRARVDQEPVDWRKL